MISYNKIIKRLFSLLFLLTITVLAQAQSKFAGRIVDSLTNEPLAFVNIVYNSRNQGTSSDLDGYFKIDDYSKIEFLKVSSVGYQTKTISKSAIGAKHYIEIPIVEDVTYLSEVTILPGENPAHRIINLVVANSDKNNPEKMRSFSYMSYNKMYFTIDAKPKPDSLKAKMDTLPRDTTRGQSLSEILEKQHLLLIESVTERIFRYPDNNKESVLAHRMSGMKNPAFTLLATQIQSMSFYNNDISLLDKRFVSPISKGATNKYFFMIEDTLYNASMDTIFVISYRPMKGKTFDGLQGIMNINSNGYAIENITASPYMSSEIFDVSIQQKCEFIDSTQWFPVQLNTNLIFNILQVRDGASAGSPSSAIVGIGKSYISDISLNPDVKRREFSNIDVEVKDNAAKQDEDFWNQYRKDSLTSKDLETYRVIDSLGKEANLDRVMEVMEILANGYIPWKFLNFDINSILWFNAHEGFRLGLGVDTNDRLCKWVSVGGFGAYGFRDKAWKYGARVNFNISPKYDMKFGLSYRKDLDFSDALGFSEGTASLTQSVQEWFLSEMDMLSEHKAYFAFTAFKYLKTKITYRYFNKQVLNTERYAYLGDIDENYYSSEVGISFRYAYKEKYLQTPRGGKLSLGTKYPILYLNLVKSLPTFKADKDYYKIEAKITKHFVIRRVGDMYLRLTAAYVGGNPPYSELYYASASYSWMNVDNTFNTMRPNEFICDRFITFHFRHDFGNVLIKKKHCQPRIVITTSCGWGDNKFTKDVENPDFAQKMNKGYFESGLQFNNIICFAPEGFGLGVYYRYGPYRMPKELDNWAFKLTWTIFF